MKEGVSPFPEKRVTRTDVARLAGVAPETASRAITQPGRIFPETTARVKAAAEALGWVPDPVAANLTLKRDPKAPTIKTIAEKVGVSKSVVSRALNPNSTRRVASTTRAQIEEVAQQLGFRHNKYAQELGNRARRKPSQE